MSAVRRAVRKVGRFIKRHWKKIVVAAAVVFTAGAALGGVGAMKTAFTSKGILGGIGSTLKAGAAGIGKLVTGQGLAAAKGAAGSALGAGTAAATTAASSIGSGLAGGSGVGSGLASTAGGQAAGVAAGGAGVAGGASQLAVGLGTNAATAAGTQIAAQTAAMTGATGAAASTAPLALMPTAAQTAAAQVPAASAPTAAGGFMNSLGGAALIQGGIGALSGYLRGQAEEDDQPKGYFGIDLLNNQNSLSPQQMRFYDPGIAGGTQSFQRPPLIQNTQPTPQPVPGGG